MIVYVSSRPRTLVAGAGAEQRSVDVELPADATVADLLARLDLTQNLAVAINGRAVSDRSTRLASGDEVLLLVPISGG